MITNYLMMIVGSSESNVAGVFTLVGKVDRNTVMLRGLQKLLWRDVLYSGERKALCFLNSRMVSLLKKTNDPPANLRALVAFVQHWLATYYLMVCCSNSTSVVWKEIFRAICLS